MLKLLMIQERNDFGMNHFLIFYIEVCFPTVRKGAQAVDSCNWPAKYLKNSSALFVIMVCAAVTTLEAWIHQISDSSSCLRIFLYSRKLLFISRRAISNAPQLGQIRLYLAQPRMRHFLRASHWWLRFLA